MQDGNWERHSGPVDQVGNAAVAGVRRWVDGTGWGMDANPMMPRGNDRDPGREWSGVVALHSLG